MLLITYTCRVNLSVTVPMVTTELFHSSAKIVALGDGEGGAAVLDDPMTPYVSSALRSHRANTSTRCFACTAWVGWRILGNLPSGQKKPPRAGEPQGVEDPSSQPDPGDVPGFLLFGVSIQAINILRKE